MMSFRECVVCKSNSHSSYYCTLDGSDYLLCDACGLIYVDKIEATDVIYTAYSGGFLKSFRRKLFAPVRKMHHFQNFDYSVNRANKIIASAMNYVSTDKGVFLDVGCNKGFLLASAKKLGWDVYGAEVVPELTTPYVNTYKEDSDHIFAGRFCDVRPKLDNNMFDLITAIDVVEHFEDPMTDFKGIYDVLKPGGTFFAQTPEADCDRAKALKEKWGALKPLEHLHLFTRDNLRTFSENIGFIDYETIDPIDDGDGDFIAIMKKPL